MIEELLQQAADIVKSGDLNLDISFHCQYKNEGHRWIVIISHVAIPDERIIKWGPLEKALTECIEATLQRWKIPKINA